MVVAVAMVSLLGDEKRAPRSCCNPQFLSRIVSKTLNPNVGVLNKAFGSAVIELDLDLTNAFVLRNLAVAI